MRSRQGRIVALAVGTLALAFPATGHAAPISGPWTGDVHETGEKGSEDPYVTDLVIKNTLTKGETGGESSYPAFPCGGDLIFRKRTRSDSFIFKEKLTSGTGVCEDGGKVKLTPQGSSLRFRWTSTNGVTATGKLKRPD